ncbi:MAG: phosphonopyruvate decarboxylase [Treponema sp.]|nr:phosphonopyruvate decarboxylase [Treponema sp.]
MLDTAAFGTALKERNFDFYSGVPCSFLKDLINYAINEAFYVMAANEGDAVAICTGAALGGKKPVVLMQNSGLGNAVSPLTSLNAIFRIPVLGFVSLRGEPGLKDEPQHELMGVITGKMLETMHIDYAVLSADKSEALMQLDAADRCMAEGRSFFFIVKKETFSKVELKKTIIELPNTTPLFQRTEMLRAIKKGAGSKSLYLATTGFTGRELYELGDDPNNLYMVGSLGCISSLGLGLSLAKPGKSVVVLDGDASLIMRMGSLAVNAFYKPAAMFHVLFDNRCHESTGGQFTVAPGVDFIRLALASGYSSAIAVNTPEELEECAKTWSEQRGLLFVYCPVGLRSSKDLARPSIKPPDAAQRLINFIHSEV